jgi:hypothetical protein
MWPIYHTAEVDSNDTLIGGFVGDIDSWHWKLILSRQFDPK